MAESAALLVDEVFPEQPVRQWVLSVPYPLRFLFASRPAVMGGVLGIVYRGIATHLIKKAGFSRNTAQTGALTLIQRFGSALNLNIHFHMLFLDGVYVERRDGSLRFRWVKAPSGAELAQLTQTLVLRIGRYQSSKGCGHFYPSMLPLEGWQLLRGSSTKFVAPRTETMHWVASDSAGRSPQPSPAGWSPASRGGHERPGKAASRIWRSEWRLENRGLSPVRSVHATA